MDLPGRVDCAASKEALVRGALSQNPTKTILLVDDTQDSRLISKWFLAELGFVVHTAHTAEDALAIFEPRLHDIVITDNSMPGMSGEEMAHIIKMRSPSTPVLMYSGTAPFRNECIDAVILKPAGLPEVHSAVCRLLHTNL